MVAKKSLVLALLLVVLSTALSGCWFALPWMEDEEAIDIPPLEGEVEAPEPDLVPDEEEPAMPTSQKLRSTVLYMMDSNMQGLVHFPTQIPLVTGIAKSAVRHLVDEPQNYVLTSGTDMKLPLPSGTAIIGAAIKDDGLCRMDFTEELLSAQSQNHEQMMIDAIVYTLTEFDTIDKVQIMVEGKILDELPFGTKVDQPLQRSE